MQLSQEIFNILKGANIKLKLFDPLGNKTLDPEQSARFYAYDNDFLITIRNSDEQVELVVQAGASFNFNEHKDVLNSIKKAGHNAMAEYNIRKFDKKIEPKDFAHETVKEESTEIDRLKELSGITPVKEQILTEWVWLVPMLATAVRIGVPALKLLLKGGKAASKVIKPVAVTTTTNLVKKSTTSGVIVGATGMWAWDKVTDVVDAIKEWGVDMDDDALGIFSQIVVKYGIPAAAVGAILYGGKQLKDYMAGDEAEKDAENEKGDTTINNYYGADQQPATEEVISEEPVFPEEVELAGDSIWIEDEMWESDYIEVSDVTVETDEDGYTQVHVEHNGPWEIYTDTGFEKEISKLVGKDVHWSEQGMQAAGVAHLEAFAQSNESADEVRRLKELSGIQTEDKELNEYRSRRNVNWDRSQPDPDPKKYPANKKQYGPIATHSGRVIYYNPAEGNYSDGDTGKVLTWDEWNEAEMPPQGADIEGSAPTPKYGLASMHPQLDKDKEQWSLEMWAGDMESRMAGLTDEANTEHKTKLKNEHPDIYAKAVEMYPDFALEQGSHPFRRMDPRDPDLKRQRGDDSPAGKFDVSKIPDGEPTEVPRDGNTNNEIGDKNIFNSESTSMADAAYDTGQLSDCCGAAPDGEIDDNGQARCGTCGDYSTFSPVEESYSPGDENEAGYVSNCCGAPIADVSDGIGRCSDCKEMAEAEKESEYYEGTTVTEDPEERKMQVTNADKEGNTEAWKRFRAGDPRYEWAGDKKEEAVTEAGEKKVSFKDFMSWFFSDSGDDEYAGLGQEAVDTINREGSVTYTPQDMFNRSGYIPGHLVQGASQEEEDAEYDPSELTLVESTDSITISKFGDGFIAEGYTPATGSLKTSYIQLPENTKLIIKHSKGVNEEVRGSRSRNIKALFIENSAGERFRFPQKYLQGAKAMANHVSHGGTPYDAIGESIIKLCEDVAQCSQFLRHVRTNKLVNENNEYIVETIKAQLKEFKNTVKGLQTVKGYNNYQAQASTIVEEKDAETVDITGKFMYNTFKTANMDAVLETVARIVKERDTMTDLTKQNISRLYDMIKGKEDFKLTIDPNDPEHPDNEDPIKYSGGMGEMAKLSAMLTYLAMSSKNDEVFNVLSHLGSELYNMPDNHVIMLDKITKYLDKNNKTSSNTVEVEGLAESILSELRRNIA